MADIFYGYSIKKCDFWDFAPQIVDYFFKIHPVVKEIDERAGEISSHNIHKFFNKLLEKYPPNDYGCVISLRVFDATDNYWIFDLRTGPLYNDMALELLDKGFPIEPIYFDNYKKETCDNELHNLVFPDFIAGQKQKRKFFIYPVLTKNDIWSHIFKKLAEK